MPDAGKRITLQEYVISECRDKGQNQGLESVIMAIAEGSRRVQQQVQQAALADALGVTGDTNVQGEIVQRLDTASSDIFVETLSQSGHVAAIGCEEIERPVIVEGDTAEGYIVLMDPLDGSSNIDVAVSIGSIFGIWQKNPDETVNDDSLLRPGNQQVAAAYVDGDDVVVPLEGRARRGLCGRFDAGFVVGKEARGQHGADVGGQWDRVAAEVDGFPESFLPLVLVRVEIPEEFQVAAHIRVVDVREVA